MTEQEKYKIIYEYQRGGSELFPKYDDWLVTMDFDNWSSEDIEREYSFALIAKERTDSYHKMIKDNSYVLINNGISEEEIEYELKTPICKCNMEWEIEKLLFVIETLKAFNIYYPDIKINDIEVIGGGYYEDGIVFGYNIDVDNGDLYRIDLMTSTDIDEDNTVDRLSFNPSNNKELMTRQLEMLKKFEGFYNSETILSSSKKLEDALYKHKMHI